MNPPIVLTHYYYYYYYRYYIIIITITESQNHYNRDMNWLKWNKLQKFGRGPFGDSLLPWKLMN